MIYSIKYIGITLIAISCIYTGINKASICEEKIYILEIAKLAVITIKHRLLYTLSSPEDLLRDLMKDERFNNCDLFKESMRMVCKFGFEKGWKQCIDQYSIFDCNESDIICSLADILGKSDLETQIEQLNLLTEQLNDIVCLQKSKLNDNRKLYTTLGMLSAFAVAVLFL